MRGTDNRRLSSQSSFSARKTSRFQTPQVQTLHKPEYMFKGN